MKLALTIKGDEIVMDFAGTDAQVDRAINCALCYTNAMCDVWGQGLHQLQPAQQ